MRKQRKISAEIERASPAFLVIQCFGGLTRFCNLTGYATSTAYDWLKKGLIPADKQEHILRVAAANGVDLEPVEFVPVPIDSL